MSQEFEKYRPSNGAEGENFMQEFCYNCKKDRDCDIAASTFIFNVTDPEYPKEWRYDKNDNPICTAFEKA